MAIEKSKSLIFLLILIFSRFSHADNYCGVPYGYPTRGLDYDIVIELVPSVRPNSIWKCGLMSSLRKFEVGRTGELHYANAFILLDKEDFSFVSLKKSMGIQFLAERIAMIRRIILLWNLIVVG